MKYYGLLPQIGMNVHSCTLVESLSDWSKCFKKYGIVVVCGVKENGLLWVNVQSQEKEWVEISE